MEASGILEAIQAETTCVICLDYMREPVTIECGHNFCQVCLQASWQDHQDRFPCPFCRYPCQERQWTANSQLAKIIDTCQLLHSSRNEMRQQGPHLCERHNQVLSFFCEEDLQMLCSDCVQPPDHQDHHVGSVEEVAPYYRQCITQYSSLLTKYKGGFQEEEDRQNRRVQELRDQVTKKRVKLASELKHTVDFLNRQHEAALSSLAEEEKSVQHRYNTNSTAFEDNISSTEALLKDIAEKSVLPDLDMLTEVKRIHDRYGSLKPPALYSVQLRRPLCGLPPLQSAMEKIREKFRADVTLDPHTAHPNLHVSKNKKSVTLLKERGEDHLQRQQGIPFDLEVLGSEEFCGGRHYWEVQVEDKPTWAIGVCSHSPSGRLQQLPLFQKKRWTIQLQDGDYVAGGARPAVLTLKTKPRGIGVYLDWELGQISFYNLSDNSHIHSVWQTFDDSLKPYFCLGPDSLPLTLCAAGGCEE
ncbi:tripartite motif-containing protein 75-like [Erinaceus europaeus]|uniref:Tripartite motif-containing protein 75-like n=1 Tax=Erinaceus europaeus TaxID=9365 RepID=A0ABM3WEZ1_ERIEU|nr:tripartite motif-containing protein 75-like [Erinaceus europaeus]